MIYIEIWKDISGYEGYYQISNLGNIRSLDRIITGKNGDFLTWKGTEKGTDGKFYSPITFVNKEDSDKVTKQILDKLLAESHSGSSKPATSNFSSDDIPF